MAIVEVRKMISNIGLISAPSSEILFGFTAPVDGIIIDFSARWVGRTLQVGSTTSFFETNIYMNLFDGDSKFPLGEGRTANDFLMLPANSQFNWIHPHASELESSCGFLDSAEFKTLPNNSIGAFRTQLNLRTWLDIYQPASHDIELFARALLITRN